MAERFEMATDYVHPQFEQMAVDYIETDLQKKNEKRISKIEFAFTFYCFNIEFKGKPKQKWYRISDIKARGIRRIPVNVLQNDKA